LKLAILTRPDFRSPRVLAESLQSQLRRIGVDSTIFTDLPALARLQPYLHAKGSIRFHFWIRQKAAHFFSDQRLFRALREFDAIVISECSPNAFWRKLYDIERFRAIVQKPVLLHEVFYLGNAPFQLERLKHAGDTGLERYDWHLAVSPVTEIRTRTNENWSPIGLDLSDQGILPVPRREFLAVVDFAQAGYESMRVEQIRVLDALGIRTIVLDREYSRSEIRAIYAQAAVFFIQFPESFGVSIAECLASGASIFSADENWPMSWRLNEERGETTRETLPDLFHVYSDARDLQVQLATMQANYDLVQTPVDVAARFKDIYPTFFYGDVAQVETVVKRISSGALGPRHQDPARPIAE
jgi:hypothetical protein